MNTKHALAPLALAVPVLLLGACQKPAPTAPPPTTVGVVTAQLQDLPLHKEMVGRLAASRVAEVRARVTGIVQARTYTEGSTVSAGQVLFKIDPAPLEAALAENQATLAQALATAENDRRLAERTKTLAERGVVSRQALDDAQASARSSKAAVAKARAAVQTAKLNLSYATVTAPIAGRAGRALVTEGALVSQSAATPMTTVEQIDPLYVNFSQPMEVVARWRDARQTGKMDVPDGKPMAVHVTLPDGSAYTPAGSLDFTDMRVDPETGSVSLRATIANPEQKLLPGTFVTLTLDAGTLHDIMLIPQAAVQRDANGAFVLTVDEAGKVARTTITTRGIQGDQWIVDSGLEAGQKVVASGLQWAFPGTVVQTQPWTANAEVAPGTH